VRALAAGRAVLDGFSYTGGFAIAALAGGASRVCAIESSKEAIQVAQENLAANPLDAAKIEFVQGDRKALLDKNAKFDLVARPPVRAQRGAEERRAPTRTSTCGR
jgi:23S rRNA (cytosine1962-C5)-methyltransferase